MKTTQWFYSVCRYHYSLRTKDTTGHNYRGRQLLYQFYALKYRAAFYGNNQRMRKIKRILDHIELKAFQDVNGDGTAPNSGRFEI